jgi:hypothetical protein
VYQEDHWALIYAGSWETRSDPAAQLGRYRYADDPEASVTLTFAGTDLWLRTVPGLEGTFAYTLDDEGAETASFNGAQEIPLARALPRGEHTLVLQSVEGPLTVDSLTIRDRTPVQPWLLAGGVLLVTAVILGLAAAVAGRRRRWYERGRVR